MMISQRMNDALNRQVANEFGACFSYLAMAFEFDTMGLKIFSKRFFEQADEERGHAMKIARFIQDVDAKVVLDTIAKPRTDYGSALAMVESALNHEKTVTKQIHGLVELAESEKDYTTRSFLQWFIDEQVEEESTMTDLLHMVKLAGESSLFLVEGRLAKMMEASSS